MTLRLALVVPALLCPALAAAQGPELDAFLPPGADLVLVLERAKAVAEAWPQTPLHAVLTSPAVQGKLEKPKTRQGGLETRIREATGHSLGDILESVEGTFALVVPDFGEFRTSDSTGVPARWAILARGMDPSLYEDITFSLADRRQASPNAAAFPAWVESGSWRIIAQPPTFLRELAAAPARSSGEGVEAARGSYRALRAKHPDADAYLALDLGIAGAFASGAFQGLDGSAHASAMGINASSLTRALGFDALEALTVAARIRPEETRLDQTLLFREDRGLVKLLAYLPGPVPEVRYLPEDAVVAWINRFDATAVYRGMVEMFRALNPGLAALVELQIQQTALSGGLDFQRDLLDRVGTDGFSVSLPPASEPPDSIPFLHPLGEVAGSWSAEPDRLAEGIRAMTASLTPADSMIWETRDVEGTLIYTTKPGGPFPIPRPFAHASVDDLFLTGDPDALERVLRARDRQNEDLWKRSDIAGALSEVPRDASAIVYMNLGMLLRRPGEVGILVGGLSKSEHGITSVTRFLPPVRSH